MKQVASEEGVVQGTGVEMEKDREMEKDSEIDSVKEGSREEEDKEEEKVTENGHSNPTSAAKHDSRQKLANFAFKSH